MSFVLSLETGFQEISLCCCVGLSVFLLCMSVRNQCSVDFSGTLCVGLSLLLNASLKMNCVNFCVPASVMGR